MAKPKKPAARAKGAEVVGMINKSALNAILVLDKSTKTKTSALSLALGQKIAATADRFPSLHKRALAWVRVLNRMEAEDAAELMAHFSYMTDISGIDEKIAAVERLPLGEGEGEGGEGEAAEEGAGDDKVSRPRFGGGRGGEARAAADAAKT